MSFKLSLAKKRQRKERILKTHELFVYVDLHSVNIFNVFFNKFSEVFIIITLCSYSAILYGSRLRERLIKRIRSHENPLNTKRTLLYLKTQSVPSVNTFNLGYKSQSVYAVSGTSRCLFSDKHKTHKYGVGRTYSCWMLNCWCVKWPVGFKRLKTKRRLLYLKTQFVPRSKHFSSRL